MKEKHRKYQRAHLKEFAKYTQKWAQSHKADIKTYGKQYCLENKEKIAKRQRKQRARDRNKIKKREQIYRSNHAEKISISQKAYRYKHPERIKANNAVIIAIRSGKLIRPNQCSNPHCDCTEDIQGHHWSYLSEHRLDVIWNCCSCHKRIHSTGQAEKRDIDWELIR